MITRRLALGGLAAGLAGCDRITTSETAARLLDGTERLNLGAHRLLTDRTALAREYRPNEVSPVFRTNGTSFPDTPEYRRHLATGFSDWRLVVDGAVRRPLQLALGQLVAMPSRSQITRHDCVEGWSAIGGWTGPLLKLVLDMAGVRPGARYVAFHCADRYGQASYYESIDLVDAYHPQTILAWGMNGRMLDVDHGAPLRLRVERMLGYKHAKYLERIEVRESLDGLYGGRGGTWEDLARYEWYAGI